MKIPAAMCTSLFLTAVTAFAAPTRAAVPTQPAAQPPATAPARMIVVAERSRTKRHHRATVPPANVARPVWRGADPTWGPGTAQMREYQRQGRCVIDEGYGRFTFCDMY